MTTNTIKTFLLRYNTQLRFSEVPLFRGAILSIVPQGDVLFHNHLDDGFRYSYPLVQYKCIGGKAAIQFVGDGAEHIAQLFNRSVGGIIQIGKRAASLEIDNMDAKLTTVAVWNSFFHYTIRKYLPLNKQNYELYTNTEDLSERVNIIEHCLIGNIISFAKGVGLHIDRQIEAKITKLSEPNIYRYKGVKMMGFDLEFNSNISLPDYIGLGKGVSLGFGMIKRMTKQ